MKTRIKLHADFGRACPDSKAAADYIRTVVGRLDGVTFERKLMRRKTTLGFGVQFSVLADEEFESREAAEELVDEIHHEASGSRGYENMVILDDGGIELVEPVR